MKRTHSELFSSRIILGYRCVLLLCILLVMFSSPLHASDENLQSLYNFQSKMAAQGSSEAMIKLGQMHEDGLGTEKNDLKALEWYQRALDKGHPEAQSHIDNLYKRQADVLAREKEREQAAREQAAREQAAHEEELRARDEREAAERREAARKAMTPEQKAQAREEAMRRAETEYQEALQKRIAKEQAEAEALKRSRNAAAKKR